MIPVATDTVWPAGDDWAVNSYMQTDGDTVRAHMSAARAPKEPWRLGPYEVVPTSRYARTPLMVRTRRDLPGVAGRQGPSLRLITLQAPEKEHPVEWNRAIEDLAVWLRETFYGPGIRAETWEDRGAFSRMLADLYAADDRGNTASQYMLRRGWLPYLKIRTGVAG